MGWFRYALFSLWEEGAFLFLGGMAGGLEWGGGKGVYEMVSERERELKTQWQRRVRAERRALGLCRDCGKGAADHPTQRAYCGVCGEKVRERMRRRDAREKAKRAAEGRGRLPSPGVVCPDCGGRCIRFGRTGRQGGGRRRRYQCAVCQRTNLGMGRRLRFRRGGAGRWKLTFYLNDTANDGLLAFCGRYGVTYGEAIRRIFREAAVQGPFTGATGRLGWDAFGEPVVRVRYAPRRILRPGEVPVRLPRRLPDLRAMVARKRMQQGGEARYRPSVLLVRLVGTVLDDLAMAGLVETAQHYRMTHQEAARLLLTRQR